MTSRSTGLACLLALTLWSCGTEETAEVALHGSVSRIYPLQYDSVRARLFTSELAIQYVSGREVIISAVNDAAVSGLPAVTRARSERSAASRSPLWTKALMTIA